MSETTKEKVTKYWEKMGRLNLLTGVIGAENIKRESDQHFKNREAEEAYVRRTAWGSTGEESKSENEGMRDTVLGDIIHPTPVVMPQQQQSSLLPAVLGAMLGAGVPLAGLAGYMLNRPATQAEAPAFDDESVNVGLGKLEDYLNKQ